MSGKEILSGDLPVRGMKAMAAVFVVTLVALKLVTMVKKKKRYNLPPGPWGLPIVGYLPFFGTEPHVTFTKMRKTYGDVVSVILGSWSAVVISGMDAIKEALVTKRDDFSGRPAFTTARLLSDGRNFGFSTYGHIWKMHRKNASNVLHAFTSARKIPIEDIIHSEASTVIEEFLSHGKKSFCPLIPLDVAGASLIYQLCYGRHKNIREDAEFMEFIGTLKEFTDFARAGNPFDVMPWLRYIMPSKFSSIVEQIQSTTKLRAKKVEEHESSFDGNNLRDITDGLIDAGNHLTKEERAVGLDKRYMVESLDSIFGAGASTVANALKWGVGLMAAYPKLQEKVFQQIDTVVGQNRNITLADRAQLALVEATIYEVLRYIGTLPFTVPHSTTCDTTLQGYDIPEGTVVLVNLYSIFADEKLWGDPKVFRPKRFLDSEGQLDQGLIEQACIYSLGRRRCMGEFLSRVELFLFFGTLIQRLKFFKPPGQPDYVFQTRYGLTLEAEPFDVCVSPRE